MFMHNCCSLASDPRSKPQKSLTSNYPLVILTAPKMPRVKLLALKAVGIFFGCGHSFAIYADETPVLSPRVAGWLVCPCCSTFECLNCGSQLEMGASVCFTCRKFWAFDTWVGHAVSNGFNVLRMSRGIINVPSVTWMESSGPDWTDRLTLGFGDILIEQTVGANGQVVITTYSTLSDVQAYAPNAPRRDYSLDMDQLALDIEEMRLG